jgi:hypothetical protein
VNRSCFAAPEDLVAAHAIAVRSLGLVTVAYAIFLAWMPVALLRSTSQMGEIMGAITSADPATGEKLAKEGKTPQDLRDAFATAYRRQVLVAGAPELALDALAAVAGLLLVFRRRLGAWLLLAFLAWPVAVAGYRWLRDALSPLKTKLQFVAEPHSVNMVRLHAFGGTWEGETGVLLMAVRLAFTALAVAVLAWWLLAARRARRVASARSLPPA